MDPHTHDLVFYSVPNYNILRWFNRSFVDMVKSKGRRYFKGGLYFQGQQGVEQSENETVKI